MHVCNSAWLPRQVNEWQDYSYRCRCSNKYRPIPDTGIGLTIYNSAGQPSWIIRAPSPGAQTAQNVSMPWTLLGKFTALPRPPSHYSYCWSALGLSLLLSITRNLKMLINQHTTQCLIPAYEFTPSRLGSTVIQQSIIFMKFCKIKV